MKPQNKPKGNSQLVTLRRGFQILQILTIHPQGYTFNQLRSICQNLPASTLSRLLKVLVDERLVEKKPDSVLYKTGEKFIDTARVALGTIPRWESLRPILDDLAENTMESAAYFESDTGKLVLRSKTEHPGSFHYQPAFSTTKLIWENGFGQVCLAYMKLSELNHILGSADKLPFSRNEFYSRARRIKKEQFFYISNDTQPGITRFISPVLAAQNGTLVGAIGITVLKTNLTRKDINRYKEHVLWASRSASILFAETHLPEKGSEGVAERWT